MIDPIADAIEAATANPAGWPRIRLAYLCSRVFRGGGSQSRYDRWDHAEIDAVEGVLIKEEGIDLDGLRRTDFPPSNPEQMLRPGDVLVKASGTPGVCAVLRDDRPLMAAPDVLVARPDPAKLLPDFLALVLTTRPYRDRALMRDQQHLNVELLSRYPILAPPIATQERIVAAATAERKRTQRLIDSVAGQARVVPGPEGGLAGLLLERRLAHAEELVFGRLPA